MINSEQIKKLNYINYSFKKLGTLHVILSQNHAFLKKTKLLINSMLKDMTFVGKTPEG